jgi:hypothetical protein
MGYIIIVHLSMEKIGLYCCVVLSITFVLFFFFLGDGGSWWINGKRGRLVLQRQVARLWLLLFYEWKFFLFFLFFFYLFTKIILLRQFLHMYLLLNIVIDEFGQSILEKLYIQYNGRSYKVSGLPSTVPMIFFAGFIPEGRIPIKDFLNRLKVFMFIVLIFWFLILVLFYYYYFFFFFLRIQIIGTLLYNILILIVVLVFCLLPPQNQLKGWSRTIRMSCWVWWMMDTPNCFTWWTPTIPALGWKVSFFFFLVECVNCQLCCETIFISLCGSLYLYLP